MDYIVTCAFTTTGQAYCWGDNASGDVGDNTTTGPRLTPTAVNTTTGLTTTNVAAIAAGAASACAITTAGATYCWGDNTNGQIGDATTTNRLTPKLTVTTAIPGAPATPTGLAGNSGGGTGQVPLTWGSVAGTTDYQIQYRLNGSGGWTQTPWQAATTLTVGGLTNGTTYEFQVRAHNAGGYSAWSASVTATP